jgi:hypothetical protein
MQRSKLDVCVKCGWYGHGPYCINPCDPKSGDAASKLAAALPEVSSTKLGYGYRNLAFEMDPNFHVQLEVDRRDQSFNLQDVWLLNNLSHDDAADLVKTLAAWRARQRDRAAGYVCTCLRHDLPTGHHTHACAERDRARAAELAPVPRQPGESR